MYWAFDLGHGYVWWHATTPDQRIYLRQAMAEGAATLVRVEVAIDPTPAGPPPVVE